MLVLFYSLAFHMYRTLGRWPSSIGETGFPRPLVWHGRIAGFDFYISLLFCLFLAPAATAVCLAVPRWRYFALYFGIFIISCLACWGIMQLAPEAFLNWWRD